MRRRTRGGINAEYKRRRESIKETQLLDEGQWGNVEKMDVCSNQSRVLEVAGGTTVCPLCSFFGVEIVNTEGKKKKHEQKEYVKEYSPFHCLVMVNITRYIRGSQLQNKSPYKQNNVDFCVGSASGLSPYGKP